MIIAYVTLACITAPLLAALLCAASGKGFIEKSSLPLSLVAAGFILALGLGHVLPEAMEAYEEPHAIGITALCAILILTLFEMLFAPHEHGSSKPHGALGQGGAALLSGSFLHTVCDGVVIASAFMSDPHVGIAVTAAVIMHEIPHEVGDYALMITLGMSKKGAFCVNATALSGSLIGAGIALAVLHGFEHLLPFVLAVSAASFMYVALSDILPRLRAGKNRLRSLCRFVLIALGAILSLLLAAHD